MKIGSDWSAIFKKLDLIEPELSKLPDFIASRKLSAADKLRGLAEVGIDKINKFSPSRPSLFNLKQGEIKISCSLTNLSLLIKSTSFSFTGMFKTRALESFLKKKTWRNFLLLYDCWGNKGTTSLTSFSFSVSLTVTHPLSLTISLSHSVSPSLSLCLSYSIFDYLSLSGHQDPPLINLLHDYVTF